MLGFVMTAPEHPGHYMKTNCRNAAQLGALVLTLVVCVVQNNHWVDADLPLVNHVSAIQPSCCRSRVTELVSR